MEKVGVYDYHTEVYSLDFRGQLTIPALANYLLHTSTCHASERGYGFIDMAERDLLWVLSRFVIDISDNKRLSEPIRIYTWVEGIERILTYRCFEITTLDGENLGYARSAWAGINRETRRPASLENLGLSDYVVERPCPIVFDKFDIQIDESASPVPYKVKYSDLDINGHLNSIKYMESILDLFDVAIYRTRSVARFDIIYQSEGFYGMELELHKQQLSEDEYVASICKEGKPICRAKIRFRKVDE